MENCAEELHVNPSVDSQYCAQINHLRAQSSFYLIERQCWCLLDG